MLMLAQQQQLPGLLGDEGVEDTISAGVSGQAVRRLCLQPPMAAQLAAAAAGRRHQVCEHLVKRSGPHVLGCDLASGVVLCRMHTCTQAHT